MGPVVFAASQLGPAVLGLPLPWTDMRHKSPQRCKVDEYAVIQIWIPKRRDPLDFISEDTQLVDKSPLGVDFSPLDKRPSRFCFLSEAVELSFLVVQFWQDEIVQ